MIFLCSSPKIYICWLFNWIFLNCSTARNPHAPDRYTGGSSSGPAAIVASGLCSAALGTDGGGCANLSCQTNCLHPFFFMYWSFFKILEKGRFGSYSFFSMWCGRVEDKLRANKHEGVISQTMWWFNHHQLLLFIPQESDLSQCRNNYILWSSISFGLMISHFVLWVWNKVTKLFFSMRHTKEKNMRSLVKGEMIEN